MTIESQIGRALQLAREEKGFDQAQAEHYLRLQYADTPLGALSRWERGEAVPEYKFVIWLLHMYRADIYLFMLHCGLEEMRPVDR